MKNKITSMYKSVKVVCTCGHSFETRSTFAGDIIKLDICSNCHPFYNKTNDIKHIAERTEKFNKKFNL